jgi:DNA polymerase-1
MFPNIPAGTPVGLDFETTGLKYWEADFRVLWVGIAHGDQAWAFEIKTPGVVAWLKDVLYNASVVVAHNAQFDLQCARVLGIDPRAVNWHCTMVAECLIDEHALQYDLYNVALRHRIDSQKRDHLAALTAALGVTDAGAALSRLADAPLELVARYIGSDARDTLHIYLAQQTHIREQELEMVLDLEMRLLPVLADMSWHGVRVDLEAAHAAIPALDEQEEHLQKELNNIVGKKLNVNSTPQIRELFAPTPVNRYQWRLSDGSIVGPTKGGKNPSIGQDALREMVHPAAALILAIRKTIKLRDTFIRGHIIASADRNAYVHTSFNQTRTDSDAGTVTGRLSSTDPALQQITKRDKANAEILRSMFLPDDGDEWMCSDYSQVDFRCGAHLQNDPKIISAYWANPKMDYHQIVSDMTGIPRNPSYPGAPNTKQINLGLSFGAGAGKLAFMMHMPYEIQEWQGRMAFLPGPEAKAVFDKYHSRLPAVKKFMKFAEGVAKTTGFVRTATGRRLRFPRGHGCHKAAGLLYQSYAADLHKLGLIATDAVIRRERMPARLMVSVHDEIGVSMPYNEEMGKIITKEYTNFNSDSSVIKMRVPITASTTFGKNWYLAGA